MLRLVLRRGSLVSDTLIRVPLVHAALAIDVGLEREKREDQHPRNSGFEFTAHLLLHCIYCGCEKSDAD
jgi:hypothetical protein